MSWQERRRPKKKFSGIDDRVLPQNFRGKGAQFKAVFAKETRLLLPPRGYRYAGAPK